MSIVEKWPHLCRAALEMSYDNGGINRDRSEDDFYKDLEAVLGAEGVYDADLDKMDLFIATLSKDDVQTLLAGEESEMAAVVARYSEPEKLDGLLNDIFDNAA